MKKIIALVLALAACAAEPETDPFAAPTGSVQPMPKAPACDTLAECIDREGRDYCAHIYPGASTDDLDTAAQAVDYCSGSDCAYNGAAWCQSDACLKELCE